MRGSLHRTSTLFTAAQRCLGRRLKPAVPVPFSLVGPPRAVIAMAGGVPMTSRLCACHTPVRHQSTSPGSPPPPPMPTKEALLAALDQLGLAPTCTDQDVKTAFQNLMKLHHPDVKVSTSADGDAVSVEEITVAYQLLRRTNVEVRAAILAGRTPPPSSFTGQSDFQYSAEEYERAMRMYKGTSRRPRSATPVDGRTASFNQKGRDTTTATANQPNHNKTPAAAGGETDGGEYALNPAPWINQRRHEAIFKTKEASLFQRYWVLCGLPVIFLFVAWMIWWWAYWKFYHPYFFPSHKKNDNSNAAAVTMPPKEEGRPPMSPPRPVASKVES